MPKKIGELLIDKGLISKDQFEHALEMQRLTPSHPIGQVLCQLGYLQEADLQITLDINKKRKKIGEILIDEHLLDQEKLDKALMLSEEEHIPLGRALLKLHLLEEERLAVAIAHQNDLPFLKLSSLKLQAELATIVTPSYAQRNRLVPVKMEDGVVTIAMASPLPLQERHQLEQFLRQRVKTVIAKESDIAIAQQRLFKISGTPSRESLQFEISEDSERDLSKSKYVHDMITADVEYLVKKIITTGIRFGASDIHFESTESGLLIRYRLDGMLQGLDLGSDVPLISANGRQIISKIKILCDLDISEKRRPQDGSFKMTVTREGIMRSVDFRVSIIPTNFGENVVIRILDKQGADITLDSLGYAAEQIGLLNAALEKPTGIFLVTGPTGSGKSTTLYAVLSKLNTPESKILTVEDPIEYTIGGIVQTELNEAIGNTFPRLLRSFLRQDPDTIMVGEIRDSDTAVIATRAALTGHTVLSTLHTNDATGAIQRLINMGVDASLIASTLRCVIAQRLVRKCCMKCRETYLPHLTILEDFGLTVLPEKQTFLRGKGCPDCNYTGYSGRLPIIELWIPTHDELLLLNRCPDDLSLRAAVFTKSHRPTMLQDGFRRVLAGETTLEELLRTVPYEQVENGRNSLLAQLKHHNESKKKEGVHEHP